MDAPFPIGFPFPTAFYLLLYVLTFALHQIFAGYVMASSLYLTWRSVVQKERDLLTGLLQDWTPFMLSAAITVGVAPLLFVQIVYQRQFYTAHLLLGWRWLIVIVVLVIAFYLLYVIKARFTENWRRWVRAGIAGIVAICFFSVAACWMTNFYVAADESQWTEVYVTDKPKLNISLAASRLLVWLGGCFASLGIVAAVQLWCRQTMKPKRAGESNANDDSESARAIRRLALLSGGGLLIAVLAAMLFVVQLEKPQRNVLKSSFAVTFVILTAVGVVLQAIGWLGQYRAPQLRLSALFTVAVGFAFSLIGAAVVRETLRISRIEIADLFPRHQHAASIGGFWIFLVFAVLNLLLIGFCVGLVRRKLVE